MYFSFLGFRTLLTWIFWSGSAKVPQQQGHLRLTENSIRRSRYLVQCQAHDLETISSYNHHASPCEIIPTRLSKLHTRDSTSYSYRERSLSWEDSTCNLWEPVSNDTIRLRQKNKLSQSVCLVTTTCPTRTRRTCRPRNIKHIMHHT